MYLVWVLQDKAMFLFVENIIKLEATPFQNFMYQVLNSCYECVINYI